MREQETITLRDDLQGAVERQIALGVGPMAIAQEIADKARELAPVETGRYREGIIAARTQYGARVVAEDEKSSWIEFGRPNHNVNGQFILRRAVDALGLKFVRRSR